MNEKFVKVEVYIDTTNPDQLSALNSLLSVVGGSPAQAAQESKPESSKPVKPGRSTRSPKPEVEKPTPEPEPEQPGNASEEDAEPGDAASEGKEYKIEEVREKLRDKVADHREEIKAKLNELGAPNVSSLDPSKYTEFVNFLEGLE